MLEGRIMNSIPLDLGLAAMLQEAAKVGAKAALVEAGLERENVSYNYACKRYGKTRVDRWLESGQLSYAQDVFGSTKRELNKVDLQALNAGDKMVGHIKIT